MVRDSKKRTTIECSREAKDKLSRIAEKLAKILHRERVPLGMALDILLTTKSLNALLEDYILELEGHLS
jgi:hypothetical protein